MVVSTKGLSVATSEERRAASDTLGAAIAEHFQGTENLREDGMIGDWIVIACQVYVDGDGDPNAQYLMAFSGGSMLAHVAQGLVSKADDMLAGGEFQEDPE